MNRRNWILTFTMLGVSAFSGSARASVLPELTQHLNEMLDAADGAVNSCELAESESSVGGEWYYRRFWLRFRPRVAVAIPGVAKLEIVPELETLWQRDLPEGWEPYKP